MFQFWTLESIVDKEYGKILQSGLSAHFFVLVLPFGQHVCICIILLLIKQQITALSTSMSFFVLSFHCGVNG